MIKVHTIELLIHSNTPDFFSTENRIMIIMQFSVENTQLAKQIFFFFFRYSFIHHENLYSFFPKLNEKTF